MAGAAEPTASSGLLKAKPIGVGVTGLIDMGVGVGVVGVN